MFRCCGLDRHPTPSNNRAAGPETLVCAPAPGVCRVREPQARAQAVSKVIVMS
jgi:hypothetical protein